MRALVIAFAVIITGARPADALNSCTIVSVTPIVFNPYNILALAPVDADGAVRYKCSLGTTISISIDNGLNSTPFSRAMTRVGGGTTPLAYQIFKDPTRLLVWGSTALTWLTIVSASTTEKSIPIYGRISALQDVQSGDYSDRVTITIDF